MTLSDLPPSESLANIPAANGQVAAVMKPQPMSEKGGQSDRSKGTTAPAYN
jgi:hypothetical protein